MNLTKEEKELLSKATVIIPAYNEAESLPSLLAEYKDQFPDLPVIVVNDASSDNTSDIARSLGAIVLDLPCNLGVGGAVQLGIRYALQAGFEYVIRCDADGQHPVAGVISLVRTMANKEVDLVIGARELGKNTTGTSTVRRMGIRYLSFLLSHICKRRITDPTSGYMLMNRLLMNFFSHVYPYEYPEPEALSLLSRQGYSSCEATVKFAKRRNGVSTIGSNDALYYALKVSLALIVDRARRIDRDYDRHFLKERLK